MTTPADTSSKETTGVATYTYRQAQAELEKIVAALESSRPDIDTLVEQVERAQTLIGHCRQLVAATRAKLTVVDDQPE